MFGPVAKTDEYYGIFLLSPRSQLIGKVSDQHFNPSSPAVLAWRHVIILFYLGNAVAERDTPQNDRPLHLVITLQNNNCGRMLFPLIMKASIQWKRVQAVTPDKSAPCVRTCLSKWILICGWKIETMWQASICLKSSSVGSTPHKL